MDQRETLVVLRGELNELELALLGSICSDIKFCLIIGKNPKPELRKIMHRPYHNIGTLSFCSSSILIALGEKKRIESVGWLIKAILSDKTTIEEIQDPMQKLLKLLPDLDKRISEFLIK